MGRYLNMPDILMIAVSAYLVTWAINGVLRHVGAGEYQA